MISILHNNKGVTGPFQLGLSVDEMQVHIQIVCIADDLQRRNKEIMKYYQ